MASEIEICNRALQKLGAKRIVSRTQDHKNARAVNVAFEPVRDSLLRGHYWNFAIKRAQLAADAAAPIGGTFARSFTLPSDFLCLAPPDTSVNYNDLDWTIEGGKILTNDSAPLYIRYIYRVEDPNTMDSLFRELFATELALELCDEITQSNTKKDLLFQDRKRILEEARRTNAIERVPSDEPPDDSWITARA